MIGKTNIDLIAYKPAAVFINGAYFGVHNIREKISKHYIEENFGVDKNNIDLLEEDSTVLEGDFVVFKPNVFFHNYK
ncbi:MAG: CotH kinase family protein [Bacteroidetes bacterium]|nr:CotH kinase family protein [Bacteroidota bacterium]